MLLQNDNKPRFYKGIMSKIIMKMKACFALLFSLVVSMSFVYAVSSSTTEVTFTILPNNESNASAFNGHIDSLQVGDKGFYWIYFTWNNTNDTEFSHNLIFLDNIMIGETSGEFFNVTGLNEDTQYEISIIPVSNSDELGLWRTIFERTLLLNNESEDESEDESESSSGNSNRDDDKTRVRNILKSVPRESVSVSGNSVLVLSGSSVGEGDESIILVLVVLVLLIFMTLILILMLLVRR